MIGFPNVSSSSINITESVLGTDGGQRACEVTSEYKLGLNQEFSAPVDVTPLATDEDSRHAVREIISVKSPV